MLVTAYRMRLVTTFDRWVDTAWTGGFHINAHFVNRFAVLLWYLRSGSAQGAKIVLTRFNFSHQFIMLGTEPGDNRENHIVVLLEVRNNEVKV